MRALPQFRKKELNTLLSSIRVLLKSELRSVFVHVSVENWGDRNIVDWLREEIISHSECIPSYLELLKVLLEDTSQPESRRRFEKKLTSTLDMKERMALYLSQTPITHQSP
ncbi:hypothetical protein V2J09_011248 [Rumex salicifolius]